MSIRRAFFAIVLMATTAATLAQQPTQAELAERMRGVQERNRSALQQLGAGASAPGLRMPSVEAGASRPAGVPSSQRIAETLNKAAERAAGQAAAGNPAMSLNVDDLGGDAVDPMAVLEKYMGKHLPPSEDNPTVMVFVSLSMPTEALMRIGKDAARARVPVYVRGLKYGLGKGNFQRSIDAFKPFIAKGINFQVHPDMFTEYDIRTVPAVVVVPTPKLGCNESTCSMAAARVFGDVTLDYALDRLSGRKDDVGTIARATLKRLRPAKP